MANEMNQRDIVLDIGTFAFIRDRTGGAIKIGTGPNTRTEIQFDSSDVVRLGANAELHLTQLEYTRNQMELARGVMTFRMLRNTDMNAEIDTPSVSVRPSRQGSYRISVNDAGETEITARGGDVEVFTPRGSQWVRCKEC